MVFFESRLSFNVSRKTQFSIIDEFIERLW